MWVIIKDRQTIEIYDNNEFKEAYKSSTDLRIKYPESSIRIEFYDDDNSPY